jgi:hypothetical protein
VLALVLRRSRARVCAVRARPGCPGMSLSVMSNCWLTTTMVTPTRS